MIVFFHILFFYSFIFFIKWVKIVAETIHSQ
jgi:hypothetical protein